MPWFSDAVKQWILLKDMTRYKLRQLHTRFYDFYVSSIRAKRIRPAADMPRYAKICQGMPRYAKVCQDMPRYAKLRGDCPRSWRNSRKNVLGNTLMLPIAHLSWCSLHVKVWPWGSLFWICIPATLPGSQMMSNDPFVSICVKSYAILIYLALLVISPYDPYVYRVKGCKYQ